jgi:flagellum-specific peptidoglycan hydrolase FlgJ
MEHQDNINYPRFYKGESNPETALRVVKKAGVRRGFQQIGQDFIQSLRWSQLKRQFSWENFNQISRRYATRVGLVIGFGCFLNNININPPHKGKLQTANILQIGAVSADNQAVFVSSPGFEQVDVLQILEQVPVQTQQQYLKRFAKVARAEMQKYKVPASVILGLAIWNSRYGTREIATQLNNHFGVNCPQLETAPPENLCFQDYENAWASFRAQSLLLREAPFSDMVELAKNDYQLWAAGLERLGYQSNHYTAEALIQIIQKHGLERLDNY